MTYNTCAARSIKESYTFQAANYNVDKPVLPWSELVRSSLCKARGLISINTFLYLQYQNPTAIRNEVKMALLR